MPHEQTYTEEKDFRPLAIARGDNEETLEILVGWCFHPDGLLVLQWGVRC